MTRLFHRVPKNHINKQRQVIFQFQGRGVFKTPYTSAKTHSTKEPWHGHLLTHPRPIRRVIMDIKEAKRSVLPIWQLCARASAREPRELLGSWYLE